jgi:O-antigen/teichoic acid export membrane protein
MDANSLKNSGGMDSLAKSAFWLMLGKFAAFAMTFVLPIFLVRHMDQKEFGLYKQAFLVVNTALSMLPLGFAMSAFYFLPREIGRRNQVVFNILLFYIAVGLVVFAVLSVRPSALAVLFNADDLAAYAPLIGAVSLFWITASFLEFVAVANGEAALAAGFLAFGFFTRSLLLVGAAILYTSLSALLYAALFHGIAQTLVSVAYLGSRFPRFWRGFEWSLLRSQLDYALPLGVVGLLYIVQTDLHHYFVSNRFGPAMYAVYAVGCFQLPLLGIVKESVGAVLIAEVSRLRNENQLRKIRDLIARMIRNLAAVLLPAYFIALVTGRELITALFTVQYLPSWPIFAVNVTLIPLGLISSATDPIFRAYPEHRYFLLGTRVLMSVLLFGGLWFGTKHFLLLGAIGSVVAVSLIEFVVFGRKAMRILEMSWRNLAVFKDSLKIAAAAATAALIAAAFREFLLGASPFVVLFGCGLVFAPIYLSLLFLFKVPTAEELQWLRRRASRLRRPALGKKMADSASGG